MQQFKRFQGYKPKSRKIGANPDTAGAPPTDGGAISKGIGEDIELACMIALCEATDTHEYVDHVHDDHKVAYREHPERYHRKHLYTDTQMVFSRVYRRPKPVHTHHMDVTLKEELNEVFDSHYDYKKTFSKDVTPDFSTHTYSFKSPSDKYKVTVDHNKKHNEMDVVMRSSKGDTKISGAEGHGAHKVFGTMKKIMDTHAKEHGVGKVTFYGAKDGTHEGRNKLYNHMFKKKPNFQAHDQGEGVHYSYDVDEQLKHPLGGMC